MNQSRPFVSLSHRLVVFVLAICALSVQKIAPALVPKSRAVQTAAVPSRPEYAAPVPAPITGSYKPTGCMVVVYAPWAYEDAANGTHAAYAWSRRNTEQAATDAATAALIENTAPPRSYRRTDPENVFVLGSSCRALHGAVAGGRKDRAPTGYWAYGTGFGNSVTEAELNAQSDCEQTRQKHKWENHMEPCSVVDSW